MYDNNYRMIQFNFERKLSRGSLSALEVFPLEETWGQNFCIYKDHLKEWRGKGLEWIIIEVIIDVYYPLTMIVILIKSRFMNVSADVSTAFEPMYMSYMANRII